MKNGLRNLFILFSVIIPSACCFAQPEVAGKPDKDFAIYLLMGQSNMAGRGKLTEANRNDTSRNVLVYNKTKQWVTARHPLHFDKPVAGVGPGLQFGFYMAAAYPAKKIGLVPVAVGGTSIRAWQPGVFDSATKTHPYDDAIVRIKEAMKYGIIEGVIWLQGESDANTFTAQPYITELKKLVNNLRTVTNNRELPFVAGELGQYRKSYQLFNKKVLKKVEKKIPYTKLVHSDNLIHGGDSTHFDAKSAELYGKRFGEAMVRLKKVKG